MRIVDVSEFLRRPLQYFREAGEERLLIRVDEAYYELLPRGVAVPINPSPSQDPFWDNPFNVAELERRISELPKRSPESCAVLEPDDDVESFIDRLCTD